MSILNALLGDQLDARQYMELQRISQERSADFHLLHQAGPGHEVLRLRWRNRDDVYCSAAMTFPVDAPREEVEKWKRETGWPGHAGTRWGYLKEDIRRFWDRLVPANS